MLKKYGCIGINFALYIILQSSAYAQKYSYSNKSVINKSAKIDRSDLNNNYKIQVSEKKPILSSEATFQNNNYLKSDLEERIIRWQLLATEYNQQQQYVREFKTRLKIAQTLIKLGRYGEALPELKKEVRLSKENNNLLLNEVQEKLANAHAGLGNYNKAIEYYKNSISERSDSKSLPALNNLVKTLSERIEINLDKAKNVRTKEEKEKYALAIALDRENTVKYAKRGLTAAKDSASTSTIRALIQWHYQVEKLNPEQLNRGARILGLLRASRTKAYLTLEWAGVDRDNRYNWLTKAREAAAAIDDLATMSYASISK